MVLPLEGPQHTNSHNSKPVCQGHSKERDTRSAYVAEMQHSFLCLSQLESCALPTYGKEGDTKHPPTPDATQMALTHQLKSTGDAQHTARTTPHLVPCTQSQHTDTHHTYHNWAAPHTKQHLHSATVNTLSIVHHTAARQLFTPSSTATSEVPLRVPVGRSSHPLCPRNPYDKAADTRPMHLTPLTQEVCTTGAC